VAPPDGRDLVAGQRLDDVARELTLVVIDEGLQPRQMPAVHPFSRYKLRYLLLRVVEILVAVGEDIAELFCAALDVTAPPFARIDDGAENRLRILVDRSFCRNSSRWSFPFERRTENPDARLRSTSQVGMRSKW
jgi:hypothetical protein